jgi:hypothetical protein
VRGTATIGVTLSFINLNLRKEILRIRSEEKYLRVKQGATNRSVMLERAPSSRRRLARSKRYRARVAAGLIVVMVEIDARRLDTIARLQKLTDRQCADKRQLGQAIEKMIDGIEL